VNRIKNYIIFLTLLLAKPIRFLIIHIPLIVLFLAGLIVIRYKRKIYEVNKKQPRLLFGLIPLINNKYYSLAMIESGFHSSTIMNDYFSSINKKNDFDYYINEYLFGKSYKIYSSKLLEPLTAYYGFLKLTNDFDIFHHSFHGGILSTTMFRKYESQLIKFVGCKTVILGYGDDFYMYSKVLNKSWTHTLLAHYPANAINESMVRWRVDYWSKHADCIINGMQIDGLGRWDVLPFRAECIDTKTWQKKTNYNNHDGTNYPVTIVHAPNHRFIKGTEYLIDAIDQLKKEGLKIELTLLEKKQNSEVKEILESKADIFFDQLILGYAMSTIEAFASGLPVITNLENEDYTRVFRRYSFLNECPAMSASHETLKSVLKTLIIQPKLRIELGNAGRAYAEKYHSFKNTQDLFSKVYEKIWFNKKDVDLINYYHPLLENSYNNKTEKIQHPLKENKLIETIL
jgi:hypothetical protein